jgi:hypothetical protein
MHAALRWRRSGRLPRAAVAAAREVARRLQQPAAQSGVAATVQNGVAAAAVPIRWRHGPHARWAVGTNTSGWLSDQRVFAPARLHSASWRLQVVRTRMSGWLWGKVDAFMNEEKTLIGEDAAGNQFWEIPNPVPVLRRALSLSHCERVARRFTFRTHSEWPADSHSVYLTWGNDLRCASP